MGVITTYDEYRDVLREKLKDASEYARTHLLDPDTWGYERMRDGYAADVFIAVENARRSI